MPHPDWRARLSIALPPEVAQELRERLPFRAKSRMIQELARNLCEAQPGASIHLNIKIGRSGNVADWFVRRFESRK